MSAILVPKADSTSLVLAHSDRDGLDSFRQLDEMGNLKTGWDGYSAQPPSQDSIDKAKAILTQFFREEFPPFRIAASVVGGIGITFFNGTNKVYLEVKNKGTIYALHSDGQSEPAVKKVEFLPEAIADLVVQTKT